MKKYYVVVLGGSGGPSALAVANHYKQKVKGPCILITEEGQRIGAYKRGTKFVNQVTPKLVALNGKSMKLYDDVSDLVNENQRWLERVFAGTSAYTGKCTTGMRVCCSHDELEVLQATKIPRVDLSDNLYQSTADFVKKNFGEELIREKIFSYTEKAWNVDGFLERYLVKFRSGEDWWPCKKVSYAGTTSDGSIILEITNINGTKEKIIAEIVLSCKGMGNVEFEAEVRKFQGKTTEVTSGFRALPYYKSINRSSTGVSMPSDISSIFMPEQGICLTNELNERHGLLFDTNSEITPVAIDLAGMNDDGPVQTALAEKYPSLLQNQDDHFMCPMPVNSGGLRKYFEFIITESINKNIKHINLTYFTGIGTAIKSLPDIKDIKP